MSPPKCFHRRRNCLQTLHAGANERSQGTGFPDQPDAGGHARHHLSSNQFAEFDRAVHTLAEKGEPITAEVLMKICHEQYERYYGPDFVIDAPLDVEGLRIPALLPQLLCLSLRRQLCAAAAIAKHIMNNEPGRANNGSSSSKPATHVCDDMLKVAGVDMTTPKPIEDAMALFDQLVSELEKLL